MNDIPKTREQTVDARRRLREEYGRMFDSIAALLFKHDPIGINFGNNTDEYESEAETILPRLRTCHSADDVCRVVYEEFVRWFDASNAGPQEHHIQIASDIWSLWQKRTDSRRQIRASN